MPQSYVFSEAEFSLLLELKNYAKEWADQNALAIGLAEMTLGAGLIAWGVQNGFIEMGTQLVATHLMDEKLNGFNMESIVGTAAGAGLGALAGKIIGSIGLAAMGGAIGIPAALVIGGCSAVLALAGYTAGDILHNTLNPPVDLQAFLETGSIMLVGVGLLLLGAKTCLKDETVNTAYTYLKDKTLYLKPLVVKVIANNKDELTAIATGASIGGIVASSTGSVIAAKSTGGLGLILGASSAPVLPVVLGLVGGAGIGFTLYKLAKGKGKKGAGEVPAIVYWDDTPPLPPPNQ